MWLFLYEDSAFFCAVVVPIVRVLYYIILWLLHVKLFFHVNVLFRVMVNVMFKSCEGGIFFYVNVLFHNIKVLTRKPLYSPKS